MKEIHSPLVIDLDSPEDSTVYLITTNSIVKRNGAVVMGRGIAKTLRDTYPGIDKKLGEAITSIGNKYGVVIVQFKNVPIGAFQVKYHYADDADLDLIQYSVHKLSSIANKHKDLIFKCNFPAIGNGHLKYEDVLPLVEQLPNNVLLYRIIN
jgi:hypothetical protein